MQFQTRPVGDRLWVRTHLGILLIFLLLRLSVKHIFRGNTFRFRNHGTLLSQEIAILPARVGDRAFFIQAVVLEDHGSRTPLLLTSGRVILHQSGF